MNVLTWQWILLILISIVMYRISPWSDKIGDFFKGSTDGKQPDVLMLTSSLVICWLFAKSIINASDLGYEFGIVGGVAYAGYYFSFMVAGIVIYRMRTIGGYESIHQFLNTKYGKWAVVIFTVLITFRLLNEVWSNSMVVGSFFGQVGSFGYYSALIVFTLLTLLYTLKGGMRTSIFTDLIQMALFVVLLGIILIFILPSSDGVATKIITSGEWSMNQGLNLFFVALIQVMSYPFHDPIMTDRGFVSDPKTTLYSFILATFIGGACI
ncbi:MAG: sodium:solute symporter, partial [Saprospiraceae bacterium]